MSGFKQSQCCLLLLHFTPFNCEVNHGGKNQKKKQQTAYYYGIVFKIIIKKTRGSELQLSLMKICRDKRPTFIKLYKQDVEQDVCKLKQFSESPWEVTYFVFTLFHSLLIRLSKKVLMSLDISAKYTWKKCCTSIPLQINFPISFSAIRPL